MCETEATSDNTPLSDMTCTLIHGNMKYGACLNGG